MRQLLGLVVVCLALALAGLVVYGQVWDDRGASPDVAEQGALLQLGLLDGPAGSFAGVRVGPTGINGPQGPSS